MQDFLVRHKKCYDFISMTKYSETKFSVDWVADSAAEELGSCCVVLDVEDERMVGNEFLGLASKLVDQLDF
jgi:hypothetical protein